ncbi:MAG: PHP-associated domain-containing protein [Halobacteriales archaeon]
MTTARVDLHVKVFDERTRDRARRRGLDAVVYAPHFTPWPEIRRRATALSTAELLVVPAREIFTGSWRDRKHVLALGLTEPVPDFIPLEVAMAELADQGACVLAPHPAYLTISLAPADLERHRDQLRAVERYNPKFLPWHGPRARRLARAIDRPAFASSYAHLRTSVGAAWTEIEGPIEAEADLLEALRGGHIAGVGRIDGFAHRRTAAIELAHLVHENSIEKARRVLGPGREPTHPTRALYGGRFDT